MPAEYICCYWQYNVQRLENQRSISIQGRRCGVLCVIEFEHWWQLQVLCNRAALTVKDDIESWKMFGVICIALCMVIVLNYVGSQNANDVVISPEPGRRLNIEVSPYQLRDPNVSIRLCRERLIFNMGFHTWERRYLYWDGTPGMKLEHRLGITSYSYVLWTNRFNATVKEKKGASISLTKAPLCEGIRLISRIIDILM